MYRLTGVILAILGVVLVVGGLYPSGLLGRLHGVGGFNSGHRGRSPRVVGSGGVGHWADAARALQALLNALATWRWR